MEVAAASIAVVQVVDRVLTLCKAYIDGVRDAPADFRLILIEVSSLKPILEAVQYLAITTRSSAPRDNASPSLHSVLRSMSGTMSPLEGCGDALMKLEALLPKHLDPNLPPNTKGKISNLKKKTGWPFKRRSPVADTALAVRSGQDVVNYENLKWPFKKAAAERLLNELARHKATLSLGLAVHTLQESRSFHDNIEYLVAMPGEVKINRILDWLVTIDSSLQHDKALALCFRGTGQWILAYPAYLEWKEQKRRILWLHGGPGSGKTILASKVVEDLIASCQRRQFEVCGWAYYYCNYQRGHDEMPHLLRWVISQLCRQLNHVPREVEDLLQAGPNPSLLQLAVAFTAIVQRFNIVFLVIDAMDEMRDLESMMEFILHLKNHKDLEKVQVLVVSRNEANIHHELEKISTEIVMLSSQVNNDIKAYFYHGLASNTELQWPSSYMDEVSSQMVVRAHGMFLWASLVLSGLNYVAVGEALYSSQVRTLEGLYLHVLSGIEADFREPFNQISQYILTMTELNDGNSVPREVTDALRGLHGQANSFRGLARALQLFAVIESDGRYERIQFVHASLKEYLLSARILSGPASVFALFTDN